MRADRRNHIGILIGIFYLSIVVLAAGQTAQSIQVQVLDTNGKPIAGAHIKLILTGNAKPQADTVTDENGKVDLQIPSTGNYSITVQSAGFGDKQITLTDPVTHHRYK